MTPDPTAPSALTPPPATAPGAPGLLEPGVPLRAWARGLVKVYGSGRFTVTALDGVDVDFQEGRFTAIMGPSGSGKSTLMHCMAGLDTITAGQVVVGGHDLSHMNQRALTRLRRDEVGFIFQSFNLIPTLTARENILLPLDIAHRRVDREWFDEVVATVGLGDRLTHRPDELSGGQQQRVACARALVSRPAVVFADEPTGNLDSRAATDMLSLLRRSVDELGQTVVMVTHDARAASFAHRVLFLADGRIVEDLRDPSLETILGQLADLAPEGGAPAHTTPPVDGGGPALVTPERHRGHPAHALTPEPEPASGPAPEPAPEPAVGDPSAGHGAGPAGSGASGDEGAPTTGAGPGAGGAGPDDGGAGPGVGGEQR